MTHCVQKNKGKSRKLYKSPTQTFKSTLVDRTNLKMECPYKTERDNPFFLGSEYRSKYPVVISVSASLQGCEM
ncbi:MAG: hypothetical protein EWV52_16550 [Microcystis panniformis Mp_MB_F_20051200_S6D]|uniref:Uncharacterized protein n=1 Tax=Microcystis viridis Mv_BB_P_19951000_S68D TaxID=2486270 RepID=A0A552H8L0_MICVR|nr:MAG: hypothetical protein EWV77_22460 [Microcystis viridis Mv_BB_P_19951000_S68D]TRV49757.1 MAG: hypothetical protein EWV42_12465 [Microcystis panniformis Mp_GB_SS_20050300_S99D]TRV53346.1 MAG: hypothetical protein EWV43_00100 [Microcystis panniformis Mp_MB_F_20080800_S26D]TRV61258.1 MAG: hypothetical protein EWV86_15225 [Microcystis panniformis Mp_MB_F_20051200_S9D]TRV70349.1 MAG: hypothetical protein EWV52_16550 [Microcystis panniformis Mp_MB_F_20051200_S6D]